MSPIFAGNESAIDVSMIRLIAAPEKFQNKKVLVIGYFKTGTEEDALYYSNEARKNGNSKDAVWLLFEAKFIALHKDENWWKKRNGKLVVIEGIFVESEEGHFTDYSGVIKDVSRMDMME